MGKYNFAAQRVHSYAGQLIANKRMPLPPPWYPVIAQYPPSERLVRPAMQRPGKPGKKASKLFKPLNIKYEEDGLRWEYFNDHPWDLARPRVLLEDDGKDRVKWDWSIPLDHGLNRPLMESVNADGTRADYHWDRTWAAACARPVNGEAVVQRQAYLMSTGIPSATAYDTARKELYRVRHANEIEARVAKEEALAVGAFFAPGPLEHGMKLEDQQYEAWKEWAKTETEALKQLQGSAYTGNEAELAEPQAEDPELGTQEAGAPA